MMEKLKTLIENFKTNHLNKKILREIQDHELLRSYLPEIFPDESKVTSILDVTKMVKYSNGHNAFETKNIPFHLANDIWMINFIKAFLTNNAAYQHNKNKVKDENITSFVKNDPEYDYERNRFGNDIVRCSIRDIINESRQKPWLRSDNILKCELVHRLLKYHLPNSVILNSIENNLDLIYEPDLEKN